MNKQRDDTNDIIKALIQLRKERGLTQVELAHKLGLSQQRLSEIERNGGSISAEQLLSLLREFNLPLSYFTHIEEDENQALSLQNALARLGAKYLRETPNAIIPESWESPEQVLLEALYVTPDSRLIPALAPVIVHNIHKINFRKVEQRFYDFGFTKRFYWLQESTLLAIQNRLKHVPLAKKIKSHYKRCNTLITEALINKSVPTGEMLEDFLDTDIISPKSREQVITSRDDLAHKWHIVTRIKQVDFDNALVNAETYA